MTATQFAMVEELAYLVKDNLPCKHLVLSMEDAFVSFLQDDKSSDGVLELEPMNPYNRLLLHRLADIFGFAHESVGEGDERHLVLQRCPETSIPSILVSDILWQYDEPQSPTASHQLLRRKETPPVLKAKLHSTEHTLEEREAAYLAARERIFSVDIGEIREHVKQKPRNIPVVARRMIAHALGQKINPCDQDAALREKKETEGKTDELNLQEKDKVDPKSSFEVHQETTPGKNMNSLVKAKTNNQKCCASSISESNVPPNEPSESSGTNARVLRSGRTGNGVNKELLKEQHLGAAKRMFAHALGLQPAKDGLLSKCGETRKNGREERLGPE